MSDADTAASRYLAIWNETDPLSRPPGRDRAPLGRGQQLRRPDGGRGREAAEASIAAGHQQFPGLSFTLLGDVARRAGGDGRLAGGDGRLADPAGVAGLAMLDESPAQAAPLPHRAKP